MKWACYGETVVAWEAGQLEGHPSLVDWLRRFAAMAVTVQPIFGVDIRAGLTDPTEAWATITEGLRFILGPEVEPPDPPRPIHEDRPGAVF